LIWTHKPTEKDAAKAGVGRKKFVCGQKGKFGLNCQAISDLRGRILDTSIEYGGASSDCLAFEGSDIFQHLESGLLHDDLVLFGDNAYLNSKCMVTPYPNVSRGGKDDYNFYHSQLCIHVECTFGMLVGHWGILRAAIPQNISISRSISLVHALAKLHTFCINETLEPEGIPETTINDDHYLMLQPEGYLTMDVNEWGVSVPAGLMDCGHHKEDMPLANPRQRLDDAELKLPRENLLLKVILSQKSQPHSNAIKHK